MAFAVGNELAPPRFPARYRPKPAPELPAGDANRHRLAMIARKSSAEANDSAPGVKLIPNTEQSKRPKTSFNA